MNKTRFKRKREEENDSRSDSSAKVDETVSETEKSKSSGKTSSSTTSSSSSQDSYEPNSSESDSLEYSRSASYVNVSGKTEQQEQERAYMDALLRKRQQVFNTVPQTSIAIERIVEKDTLITEEQIALLQHAPCNGERILVQAFAGAGKTTMCRWLASRLNPLRVLYLAYNKLAAAEAKLSMPANVDARTIHSLALCYMGGMDAQRDAALRFSSRQGRKKSSTRQRIASDALPPAAPLDLHSQLAVEHFSLFCRDLHARKPIEFVDMAIQQSATVGSVPVNEEEQKKEAERLQSAIIQSNRAWRRMQNGQAPYTYDAMIKQFTLDGHKSRDWLAKRYDVIILDEAQDSQPIFVDWLQKMQNLILFAVGDRFQSIYSFNGTVNAMRLLADADAGSGLSSTTRKITSFNLTHSFRFGSNVGQFATHILRCASLIDTIDQTAVRGNAQHHTIVRRLSELYAALGDGRGPIHCIARQNRTLIQHALNFNTRTLPFSVGGAAGIATRSSTTASKRKVHFFGNACEIIDQLREILNESLAWRRGEYRRLIAKQSMHQKQSTPNLSEWEQRRLQAFRCVADYNDDAILLLLSKIERNDGNVSFDGTESSDELSGDEDSDANSDSASLFSEPCSSSHASDDSGSIRSGTTDKNKKKIGSKSSSSDSSKHSKEELNSEDATHVHYGTIHSAKGLQFERVAVLDDIVCVSEACKWLRKPPGTRLPAVLRHAIGQPQFGVTERDQIREEIHLVYVALTRAKKEIFINDDLYAIYQQIFRS